MTGKSPLIIFIDSVRLQIAAHESVIKSWDFPNTLVHDGKIANRAQFESDMEKFFSDQRISAGPAVVVLSESVCFTHAIKAEESAEKEQLSRNFYDMVPAEAVVKREYEIGREIMLVAADSEFIGSVIQALVGVGCSVMVVVPYVVLPQVGTKRWLDAEYVTYLLKNAGELAPWSMNIAESTPVESNEKSTPNLKKSKPPYMLIGVFAFLVLILVVMIIVMR